MLTACGRPQWGEVVWFMWTHVDKGRGSKTRIFVDVINGWLPKAINRFSCTELWPFHPDISTGSLLSSFVTEEPEQSTNVTKPSTSTSISEPPLKVPGYVATETVFSSEHQVGSCVQHFIGFLSSLFSRWRYLQPANNPPPLTGLWTGTGPQWALERSYVKL